MEGVELDSCDPTSGGRENVGYRGLTREAGGQRQRAGHCYSTSLGS